MILHPVLLSSFIYYFPLRFHLSVIYLFIYLFNTLSTICTYLDSQDIVVHMATGLWAARSGVRKPVGQRNPLLSIKYTPTLGPIHPPTKYEPVFPPALKRLGVKFTTCPHIVQRFRMSRATQPLPPYAFMARTKTSTLLFCTHLFTVYSRI